MACFLGNETLLKHNYVRRWLPSDSVEHLVHRAVKSVSVDSSDRIKVRDIEGTLNELGYDVKGAVSTPSPREYYNGYYNPSFCQTHCLRIHGSMLYICKGQPKDSTAPEVTDVPFAVVSQDPRISNPFWSLLPSGSQLLVGRLVFDRSKMPTIGFGNDNVNFFEKVFASLYDLALTTNDSPTSLPTAAPLFKDVLNLVCHLINMSMEYIAQHFGAACILLSCILLPSSTATRFIGSCSLEDIRLYWDITRKRVPGRTSSDAHALLSRHLHSHCTNAQLLRLLPKKFTGDSAELAEWIQLIMNTMHVPINEEELKLPLLRLLTSNFPLYAHITSSMPALELASTNRAPSQSTTNDIRFPTFVTRWAKATRSLKKDIVLKAMGESFSCSSLALAASWKFFQLYRNFSGPDTEISGELDFGDKITPGAAQQLIEYFNTGIPKIVDVVDAYSILQNAQELMFCDADGQALPGHETLIFQLQFTLEVGTFTKHNCLLALGLAMDHNDQLLWANAFPVACELYSSIISSKHAKWLADKYPEVIETLTWASIKKKGLVPMPNLEAETKAQ